MTDALAELSTAGVRCGSTTCPANAFVRATWRPWFATGTSSG